MKWLIGFWLDEIARHSPEYKRISTLSHDYYYALLRAGEQIAQCSCHPHATGALDTIESALEYRFKRRYPS